MRNNRKLHATLVAALSMFSAQRGQLDEVLPEGVPHDADDLLDYDDVEELVEMLKRKPDPTIQAVVAGGLFQSASSDHPLATMFGVEVLDFDVEGSSDAPDYIAIPAAEHLSWEAGVFLRGEGVSFGKDYVVEPSA